MALQMWLPLDVGLEITNDYDTTIYREVDNSLWLRIFHHNNPASNGLFSSSDNFTNPIYKDANRWSNLQLLNQMTDSWELMVKQKATSSSSEMTYRWIQNVNPYTAVYNDVTSNTVIKINVPSDAISAIGGMYHIGSSTYFCITNGSNGNWFGAIGAWSNYSGGIPGYPNTGVTTGYLDLYLRIDKKCLRNLGAFGSKFIYANNNNDNGKYGVGKITYTSQENNSNITGGFVSTSPIDLGMKQSMFCWVYFNSFYNDSDLTGILGQHRYASNQGMGLTAKYVSSTSGYLSINTGNGSSRTYNTYCGNTLLTSGKWYHVGYTYDGTTVTLYVNGKVDGTFTITDMKVVSDYIVLFAWSLSGTSGYSIHLNYRLDGRLNDVRIYNHCLSKKEVKNISQGLMLHYSLSRSGANLLRNTSTEKSWSSTSTGSVDSNYSQDTITPSADSYYVMSFDAKSNKESTDKFITYLYNNSSGRQCDMVEGYIDGNLVYIGSGSDGSCPMPTYTYYRHYVIVRHFDNNATALTKQNVFRIYNAGSSGLTMYVKNAKIEVGKFATPWIPNSSDTLYTQMGFNRNIEDDISGYGNNGTRVNITNWDISQGDINENPRYLNSMIFNGSNAYLQLSKNLGNIYNTDFSLSVWLKPTSTKRGIILSEYQATSASNVAFELTATLQLRVYWDGNPDIKTTNSISVNAWSHVVITKTSTQILFYVNGSLFYTHNQSSGFNEKISNALPRIGDDYRTGTEVDYNGLMSDFRFYVTALSSDDVLELYKVSATIDKNKTMHCYELVEN